MVVGFIAVLAGAVIWYGPVTQSDSHVLDVAQTVDTQGLNLLPNRVPGGGLLSAYLKATQGRRSNATRNTRGSSATYKGSISPSSRRSLTLMPHSMRFATRRARAPGAMAGSVHDALSLGLLIIEQLANILAAIGALLMVLRRGASVIDRQIGLWLSRLLCC